jgi:hypothetical protein
MTARDWHNVDPAYEPPLEEQVAVLRRKCEWQEAKLELYSKALLFYADPKTYTEGFDVAPIDTDLGRRANDAVWQKTTNDTRWDDRD